MSRRSPDLSPWVLRSVAIAAVAAALVAVPLVRAHRVSEGTAAGDAALFSVARKLCGGGEGADVEPYPGSWASRPCEAEQFASEASTTRFLIGAGFFIDPEPPVRAVAWQVRADRGGVRINVVGSRPAVLELQARQRWPGLLG
ncbi:hypothetical protein BJY16_004512 [Actinoplanes octamycinicus]|uniref:Uncharacterized protein n=1 Tax=Actinoplanes octamycinicus TaxID=135948 RepID=A0A7W7GZ99_9ACTN|nr:hypothetical protein [Actinoplanes octamycinicus]MBB4741053.1 hypothetical protein [Actinoplanes octamycinicus]GIE55958.1 hypothetical protein Aoc01nite_13600 [Actinoplanes octamycinicus]